MATLKLLLLAAVFVATSGAVFSKHFKNHKLVSLLAAVVALVAAVYLFRDIYDDFTHLNSSNSEIHALTPGNSGLALSDVATAKQEPMPYVAPPSGCRRDAALIGKLAAVVNDLSSSYARDNQRQELLKDAMCLRNYELATKLAASLGSSFARDRAFEDIFNGYVDMGALDNARAIIHEIGNSFTRDRLLEKLIAVSGQKNG